MNLGIPSGVQRYFGKIFGSKDLSDLGLYMGSSLALLTVMELFGTCIVIATYLLGFANLESPFVMMAVVLVLSTGLYGAFLPLFTSSLHTRSIFVLNGVGGLAKIVVGLALVYVGLGAIGATLGFVAQSILQIIGAATIWIIVYGRPKLRVSRTTMRELIVASLPSWIPGLFSVLSQWMGVLAVFGFRGSLETGLYYVAFAISLLVTSLSQVALSLMFPVLSGMDDGRKRAVWKAIKLSFAITSPPTLLLLLYPHVPLSLLGQSYVQASEQLRLLAVSAPLFAIYSGVWSLLYAYGFYRKVLFIGLANNVPTAILYFWLVPQMGGLGAASAYLGGVLVGALCAVFYSRSIGLAIDFRSLSIALLVPSILAFPLYISHLHWLLGSLILLAVTSVAYARLGIVTRDESTQVSAALIPKSLLEKLKPYLLMFRRILYGH